MRNAPWNTDDREVLRQKWRLAEETASLCQQLLQKVEILRIRVDHVGEDTDEHASLAVDAREFFITVGQQLFESGLTSEDWTWFVQNRIPDEPEQWKELAEQWQKANKLKDLYHRVEEFIRPIAKAKREFAKAIQLTLNSWEDLNSSEEPDNPNTSWYQRVDEGVLLHGILVEVQARNAEVLLFLCQRTNRLSTYNDIAELAETWKIGMDSKNDYSIKSTKSNIRTCLDIIRKAIRQSFKLTKEHDPVKKGKMNPGWKLKKEFLQSNLP